MRPGHEPRLRGAQRSATAQSTERSGAVNMPLLQLGLEAAGREGSRATSLKWTRGRTKMIASARSSSQMLSQRQFPCLPMKPVRGYPIIPPVTTPRFRRTWVPELYPTTSPPRVLLTVQQLSIMSMNQQTCQ